MVAPMFHSIYCSAPSLRAVFEIRLRLDPCGRWSAIVIPADGADTCIVDGDHDTPALEYFEGVFRAVGCEHLLVLPSGD